MIGENDRCDTWIFLMSIFSAKPGKINAVCSITAIRKASIKICKNLCWSNLLECGAENQTYHREPPRSLLHSYTWKKAIVKKINFEKKSTSSSVGGSSSAPQLIRPQLQCMASSIDVEGTTVVYTAIVINGYDWPINLATRRPILQRRLQKSTGTANAEPKLSILLTILKLYIVLIIISQDIL